MPRRDQIPNVKLVTMTRRHVAVLAEHLNDLGFLVLVAASEANAGADQQTVLEQAVWIADRLGAAAERLRACL